MERIERKSRARAGSAGGGTTGLLLAVALVASASTAVTAAASGAFAGSGAAEPVIACVVPDAGVLYSPSGDACEEPDHALHSLAASSDVSQVESAVGSLQTDLEALSATVADLSEGAGGTVSIQVVDGGEMTASKTVDVTERRVVECPAGTTAIAGGYEIVDITDRVDALYILTHEPEPDGSGWAFEFGIEMQWDEETQQESEGHTTWNVSVSCLSLS